MSNDVTLSANIKTNIPQEMQKAAGGFRQAEGAAKQLGTAASTTGRQMNRLSAASMQAASSAKAAANAARATAVGSAIGALPGLLPEGTPGGELFSKVALGASAGGQLGGIFGPAGQAVGAGAGALVGLGSHLFDEFNVTAEEQAKALEEAAKTLERISALQEARGQVNSYDPAFGKISSEIAKLNDNLASTLEKGDVTREEAERKIEAKIEASQLEELIQSLQDTAADNPQVTQGIDIFTANTRQQKTRFNSARGFQ